MTQFDDFLATLKADFARFAATSWQAWEAAAVKDANAFLTRTKGDLARWTRLLAAGDLTGEDLRWLLAGKRDLVELKALQQRGLAKVALDKFVDGLLDLVVEAAVKAFA